MMKMIIRRVYILFLLLPVLYAYLNISVLSSDEFAILQFDSRPLKNYWRAAALWNNAYAKSHGHHYLYYTSTEPCHYMTEPLADAWCKVKAMINAMEDHPAIKVFIYMDSDAVLDKQFAKLSLNQLLGMMQDRLQWDPNAKPLVFNQDGPCMWCSLIERVGYKMCLNAGTVVWFRHEKSQELLWQWWNSTMDSYDTNPIKRRFRIKWPWEQDRQMALYNKSSDFIQVASQPDRVYMEGKAGISNGWCLSHLPNAKCFISHYCADARSKQIMRRLYETASEEKDIEMKSIRFEPY